MKSNGFIKIAATLCACILLGVNAAASEKRTARATTVPADNPYNSLFVPTYTTKIGEEYFIVDGYHNQIIFSSSLDTPLSQWKVMTNETDKGHSLASDGTYYLADDTERHRVLVFKRDGEGFARTQVFENIGNRPHMIVYNQADASFYAWSSMTDEMYVFAEQNGEIALIRKMSAPSVTGVYIRSFAILDGYIYLVSGLNNGVIIKATMDTLTPVEQYKVPDVLAGMVHMMYADGWYYLTVSTSATGDTSYANIVRTKDLGKLADYEFEEINYFFTDEGTPYYMSAFDGHYYLVKNNVWQFDLSDGEIVDVKMK